MLSRLMPGWTFPKSRVTTRKDGGRCVVGMTVNPQRIASLTVSLNDFPVRLARPLSLADTSSSKVSVILMKFTLPLKHHDVNVKASISMNRVASFSRSFMALSSLARQARPKLGRGLHDSFFEGNGQDVLCLVRFE